jgi:glycosyltransferase involved in cell wall biosynthesis
VAGDAALLIDPRDVGAMAAAIEKLVNQPELRHVLRAKGLVRAAQFRWENSAADLLRIYREIGEHP